MPITFTFIEIFILLLLIVLICVMFTNAIEWVGHRFKLSEGAVGSVLAAVGTALPETLVPIIAIISGALAFTELSEEAGHEIGIGAILGAPFLLSTLAMGITAAALFYFKAQKKRDLTLKINHKLFRRDFHYFLPAYICVFLAAFIQEYAVKIAIAVGLVVFYGIYVYRTLKKEHVPDEDFVLPPLYSQLWFQGKETAKEPSTALIMGQVAASLLGLLLLVHQFVERINHVAETFGIQALLLSLIITPIATELPEKFNSVVWIGARKDHLAMGNITGAMVFQSCIPTAVGLAFTPWVLNTQAVVSVVLCLASALLIYAVAWYKPRLLPSALILSGFFYLGFVFYVLMAVIR